ncbi:hypothetical protein SPSYN_02068 [Sporotomaculum syntrophicum]|uniref:Bacterial Pleckstrin homology domain-containing protein n=1 Tax=Sporotomaculum syntrophicum TaxID=182264 RepID=A0A9D2WPK9_9FIRM|nr:DUF3784 domain-containing protein [Sporotomaculum syntrophicum]KAF1084292.1 hypothetical protein SPSYN_02068 [Sporotomaculum syntrophicum]
MYYLVIGLTAGLLAFLGIAIKKFKWYWLISGYNTSSPQKQQEMIKKGLGEFMGNSLFFLAGIFAAGAVLQYFGLEMAAATSWILVLVASAVIVVRALRYNAGDNNKTKTIVALAISLLVLVIASVVIFTGARAPEITVGENSLKISGMYGTELSRDEIKDVQLLNQIPPVKLKTNGFNFGETLKGNLKLEELGTGKLFTGSSKGPFIYIKTKESYIIINFKDPEQTRRLYDRLNSAML